jgi:protein-L-isoaspartate(D-aspartate) O-methyltransferase
MTQNSGIASERVRDRMVGRLRELGVRDARVLAAMAEVPRHAFVDSALASRAYEDTALPIGFGQSISQPYIVARCAELALEAVGDPASACVLEIGTGCGYAAAVLARVFGKVISVERVKALHQLARERLRPLRIPNLHLLLGDGTAGVASDAPFDAIIAAAAGSEVPEAWIAQLKPGGRVVAPLGRDEQSLVVLDRGADGKVRRRQVEAVRFVPLRAGVA